MYYSVVENYLHVEINALRHFYEHFLISPMSFGAPNMITPFFIQSLDDIHVTGCNIMKTSVFLGLCRKSLILLAA